MSLLCIPLLSYNIDTMKQVCEYPGCHREAHYLNSWDNKATKHFGIVCATHDRELGRMNLVKTGMSLREAIWFEGYLKETVELSEYPDWPEWLKQHYETRYPSGDLRHDG